MNALSSDQVIPRCRRHPQDALVGVCAFCLRERLIHVVAEAQLHAIPDDDDDYHDDDRPHRSEDPSSGASMADQEEPQQEEEEEEVQKRHRSPINGTAMQRLMPNFVSSQEVEYPIRSNKSSDLGLLLPQAENFKSDTHNQAMNFPHDSHDRFRRSSLPPSCRRSNASEADVQSKLPPNRLNHCTKQSNKRLSWFPGLSKSKASSPLLQSPLPSKPCTTTTRHALLPPYLSSPLISGRKSASEAICRQPHLMMQADLGAIAEINLGESAVSLDNAEINLAAAARAANSRTSASSSTSWIASFFNRRRSRGKLSVLSYSGAMNNDLNNNGNSPANQSPKVSFDAGRFSLDGAKPNWRQILTTAEQTRNSSYHAGSSDHLQGGRITSSVQYYNGSTSHQLYASNPSSKVVLPQDKDRSSTRELDHDHQSMHPPVLPLQKCRTVAQSRSKMRSVMLLQSKARSRGGFRPSSDQAGLLSRDELLDDEICKDAQGEEEEEEEEEEAHFPRSSSWGSKAWSKTLSPLYRGFNKKQQQSNGIMGRKPNAIYEMTPSSTTLVISKPFSPLGLKTASPHLPSEHANAR